MERVKNPARNAPRVCALVCGSALFLMGCVGEPTEVDDDNIGQVSQYVTPIKISTLAQLRAMNLTGTYELANNINASATATTAFVPIGTSAAPFKGTLDGKGFTISNLTIAGNRSYAGMFGYAQDATINNVKLTNVKLTSTTSYSYTGAIAGYMRDSNVYDSQVGGTVSGGAYTGGLVGYATGTYFTGGGPNGVNVTGTNYVGGAVGSLNSSSYVINVVSTGGSVTGTRNTGGLVGAVISSGVSYSRATGLNVNGGLLTGGLVGDLYGGGMLYDSASGTVRGSSYTGGLLGRAQGGNMVYDAAVNITVNGGSHTGGMIGESTRTNVEFSFVTGDITGTGNTGGIVGSMGGDSLRRGILKQSYIDNKSNNTASTVQGTTPVGMAVGLVKGYTDVKENYAIGRVGGASNTIGGFMGEINAPGLIQGGSGINPRADVEEIFTQVEVSPNFDSSENAVYAGGLVGRMLGGDIDNVNVAGSVRGRQYVGGAIGYVVNSGTNVSPSTIKSVLTRGEITNVATANRSGAIGGANAAFALCKGAYWDSNLDGGSAPALPSQTPPCQEGKTSTQLKSPARVYVDADHPNGNFEIFNYGQLIDRVRQQEIDAPDCMLGSGSDGNFGFGFCDGVDSILDRPVWLLNSSTEYNTLINIPNPGRQPKN